ncbi:hypothetical protein ICV35_23725 [Rhodococcus ruber]|nr:hypothetical protein [Rhodococcus ruber]
MNTTHLIISDDSVWPLPDMETFDGDSIEWKLRHAPESITREDQLRAASIISAYGFLVLESGSFKRDLVCREIRTAMRERA